MIASLLAGGFRTAIAVVVVFVVMVMIHELGHFLVAKRAGVLVYRFAIGFGPKLFSFKKGETEYSLRLFPIGGYVMLAGEIPQDTYFKIGEPIAVRVDEKQQVTLIGEIEDVRNASLIGKLHAIDTLRDFTVSIATDDQIHAFAFSKDAFLATGKDPIALAPPDRQMNQKSIPVRMAIAFAGPLMNFILAIILFAIVLLSLGTLSSPPALASIEAGTPAAFAGLQPGDVLVAIDHKPVSSWDSLVTIIQSHANVPLVLTVDRHQALKTITLIPRKRADGTGFIGVTPKLDHSIGTALEDSVVQTAQYTSMITNAFGMMLTHSSTFVKDGAGPVKIVQVIGQQAAQGILQLINLTAILSLNLAILNLVPIPPLDGSRILLLLIEWIRRRPIDPKKEYIVNAVGFLLVITLMVVRAYLDVTQLL